MTAGFGAHPRHSLGAIAVVVATLVPMSVAQDQLDGAVRQAREAWLGHDMQALLATSDTVRLQVPGLAASNAMRPGQAARLLDQYLETAQEREFELVDLRRLAEDHAYAELTRSYVVRGTDEIQRETVFLGFRRVDGVWRLREVRVMP